MQEQIHDILQSLPYKLILSKAKNCEYRRKEMYKDGTKGADRA